jgi:hypothetical protein
MSRGYPAVETLKNAANSPNFNVNGSVATVPFSYAPLSNEIMAVEKIRFVISSTTKANELLTRFMNLPALTNGITAQTFINGILRTGNVYKNNFDLFTYVNATYTEGLIGSSNIMQGIIECDPPMVLDGSRGDYFRINVADNLSTLQAASAVVAGKIYQN